LSDRPLGFQKDHVISIPLFSQNLNGIFGGSDSTFRIRLQTFRDRVEAESGVEQTSVSNASPGLGTIYRGAIPEGFTQEDNLFIADLSVDYDFMKTFGMEVAAGRAFSKDYGTDAQEAFMVNEQAVNQFHWGTAQQAIGKTINREGKKGKVVGVVKDFNMESLTTPIGSLILEINPLQWNNLSVKIKNQQVGGMIDKLKSEWNSLFPEKAFEFSFLDEQLNQQYTNFQNFGKNHSMLYADRNPHILPRCVWIGFIYCSTKSKEIGVRKVLGASIGGILQLIYRDFIWLILIGFVLAVPFSYYFIVKWLENFTFHTNVDWMTYALSFTLVMAVVAITISYHAIRAALTNPVRSLRSE